MSACARSRSRRDTMDFNSAVSIEECLIEADHYLFRLLTNPRCCVRARTTLFAIVSTLTLSRS